ncbi:uncharacterized protein [Amphiura filiformis]|uniref:uncharacterized protein n=1 Tax=Amphiura filiformis TaxID=82378 RepID=UPI003B21B47E
MDRETENYYKTHGAVHFLGHHVYKFVLDKFEEFVVQVKLSDSTDREKWLKELRSVANNPKLVEFNTIPSSAEEIAVIFCGKDGYKQKNDVDFQRAFKIMKNCHLFSRNINELQLINKVLNMRNDFSHQSTKYKFARLKDDQVEMYFNTILELLEVLKNAGMSSAEDLMKLFSEIKCLSFHNAFIEMHKFGSFYPKDYMDMPDGHIPGFMHFLEVIEPEKENEDAPNLDSSDTTNQAAADEQRFTQIERHVSHMRKDVTQLKEDKDRMMKLLEKLAPQGSRLRNKTKGQKNKVFQFGDNTTVNFNEHCGAVSNNKGKVRGSGLKETESTGGPSRKRKASAAFDSSPVSSDNPDQPGTSSQSHKKGAAHCGTPPRMRSLSDAVIMKLAKEFDPNQLTSLGIALGLTNARIKQFIRNHPGDILQAIVDMLCTWRDEMLRKGWDIKTVIKTLRKALKKSDSKLLAKKLKHKKYRSPRKTTKSANNCATNSTTQRKAVEGVLKDIGTNRNVSAQDDSGSKTKPSTSGRISAHQSTGKENSTKCTSKKKVKPRKSTTAATPKGDTLITIADINNRSKRGKPVLAKVHSVKDLKKSRESDDWTFHILLEDDETSIDGQYSGPKEVCKKRYQYLRKLIMSPTVLKVTNYQVERKKPTTETMYGSHPRCRLEFTIGSTFKKVTQQKSTKSLQNIC